MRFKEGFWFMVLNIVFVTFVLYFIYFVFVISFVPEYDGLFVENLVIFVVSLSISVVFNLSNNNMDCEVISNG